MFRHHITKERALELYESKFWESMAKREIAEFQLFTELLCMPFAVFHEALEDSLGRPVFTHELGMNYSQICAEFLGQKPAPTMDEIIDLVPDGKRLIVVVADEQA